MENAHISSPAKALSLHGVAVALALTPIVVTGGLFLFDLPNHLFRVQLIADILNGKPSSFYTFDLRLIPNMPLDLAAIALRRVLDPAHITLLVTCVAAAGFYLSIMYWRATGGRRCDLWICLLAVVVLFSFPLYAGLINYIIGIAVMYIALARLERRKVSDVGSDPAFYVSQWALVVVMYLCSIFPVLLYAGWNVACSLYDATRPGASFKRIMACGLLLHLPPLVVVLGLMLLADPTPPADVGTSWLAEKKLEGLLTLGRMSNLPQEFASFALILPAIALRYAGGALRLHRRHAAGLSGMIVCFIIAPSQLVGVTLVDVRLPMAIVGAWLAVGTNTGHAVRPRLETAAHGIAIFLVAARMVSLAVSWVPVAPLNGAYAELARKVEPASAVYFVLDGLSPDERTRALIHGWASVFLTGKLPTEDALTAYATFWHLHMAAFRGKDVLLSHTFQNFTIKLKPDVPFQAVPGVPAALAPSIEVLSRDPYDYVLSHIALDPTLVPGKRLCLSAESHGIRLYRLIAGGKCPNKVIAHSER